jgi:uncharacterized BrkB/YihY/UPF0761 family membrane protein
MPNTRVETRATLVGSLFAGVLWAAVGALFARVVVYSTRTLAIYAVSQSSRSSCCGST